MKKSTVDLTTAHRIPETSATNHVHGVKRTMTFLFLAAAFCILSCGKEMKESEKATLSQKSVSTTSVQPLPGERRRFSAAVGKFVLNDYSVVRMCHYTFLEAGTVTLNFYSWTSTQYKGKTLVNNHSCTMEQKTETNNVYTPTGWIFPSSGHEVQVKGTYSFNPTTGMLYCYWNDPSNPAGWNGQQENWSVTNPDPKVAMITLNSNSYGLTHGRGYGSNANWNVAKPLSQIPRVYYGGAMVLIKKEGNGNYSKVPATGNGWKTDGLDLVNFLSSDNGNTLHIRKPDPDGEVCTSGCTAGNTHNGIIYHLGSATPTSTTDRRMVYNHYCACLPTQAGYPAYTGNLHPYAFDQIIDDDGAFRGFVGIEQQNQTGYNGAYQYQLKVYFK